MKLRHFAVFGGIFNGDYLSAFVPVYRDRR